jgi:hypothetical protein
MDHVLWAGKDIEECRNSSFDNTDEKFFRVFFDIQKAQHNYRLICLQRRIFFKFC